MSDPLSGLSARDREATENLLSVWWVPLVTGALNIVAGLVVLIEPHTSLLAVAVVVGIYLVIAGILVLAGGLAWPADRWIPILLGALAIIAGIFVIGRPGSTVHGVRIVFGIFLLISGGAHLGLAVSLHGDRRSEIVRGVLQLVAGIVFLAAPKLGLAAVALFFGVYLLLHGVLELIVAFGLRAAKRQLRA